MSFVSFTIFIGMGNTLDLASAIEIVIIFSWIKGCFGKILFAKDRFAEIKLAIRRLQDYLLQDEVEIDKVIAKNLESDKDLAVRIDK